MTDKKILRFTEWANMVGVFKGWCVVLLQKHVFWNVTLADAWRRCIQWQLGGKQLGTHARGSNGLCPVTPYMALTCFHHHGVLQPDAVWAALQGLKLGSATAAALAPPAPATSRVAQWGRYCVCNPCWTNNQSGCNDGSA